MGGMTRFEHSAVFIDLMIVLYDRRNTGNGLSSRAACLQADHLQTQTNGLTVRCGKYIADLGIEHDRGLIGQGRKAKTDKLPLFEAAPGLSMILIRAGVF